mgnify:CR=1 FL=1
MTRKKDRKTIIIRWLILGILLVGSTITHVLHLRFGTQYPSVHAICPYGGLENLWAWLAGRANIQKIFSGTMVLLFLSLAVSFVARRSFCGNICPFGALQEFFGRLFPRKHTVPHRVDRVLRWVKYGLLILSAVMAWKTMTLWFSPFDPWAAYSHLTAGSELLTEFAIGTLVLVLTLAASLFVKRPFCRYVCPAGAMYALAGKKSPLCVERNPDTCIGCGACTKACPMDIGVHAATKVQSSECIGCMRCTAVCPGGDSMLTVKMAGRRVKPLFGLLIGVVLFFGTLLLLDVTGHYVVSLPSVQQVIEQETYIGIADLRGSMTIEQGAVYTGMTLEAFYQTMEIPVNVPKETRMKEISLYEPAYDFHAIKARK